MFGVILNKKVSQEKSAASCSHNFCL